MAWNLPPGVSYGMLDAIFDGENEYAPYYDEYEPAYPESESFLQSEREHRDWCARMDRNGNYHDFIFPNNIYPSPLQDFSPYGRQALDPFVTGEALRVYRPTDLWYDFGDLDDIPF